MTRLIEEKKLIEELIARETTSGQSNLALMEYVAGYLEDIGVTPELHYSEDKTRANLTASIGPDREGGIVLSGHTDTVPVDGQNWKTDPFKLHEEGGKLYGRGTCDMKVFDAQAIDLVARLATEHQGKLKKPVHLALSYDEELGCIGLQRLLPVWQRHVGKPDLVIVGEPTSLQVANAHKGITCTHTHIQGHGVHSSNPDQGVNAINIAGRLLTSLNQYADYLKSISDSRFTPPHTTLNIGKIKGGSAVNLTADTCEIDWEFRPLPKADPREILAFYEAECNKLRSEYAGLSDHFSIVNDHYVNSPPFLSNPDHPATKTLLELTGHADVIVVPFATEASFFEARGWHTNICGPGDIAQAHQPNEYIEVSQIEKGRQVLAGVAQHCLLEL